MSFKEAYLHYLYRNGKNIEYEPICDDDSSSSMSVESSRVSGDFDQETREPPGNPPPDYITSQQNHEFQPALERSRPINHYDIYLYRLNKVRENDGAGEIFLKRENPSGSARTEKFVSRKKYDMFAWLSSKDRKFPKLSRSAQEILSSIDRGLTLPLVTKYRNLKQAANLHMGVYRSKIHGRGLFSLVDIEPGEMVIEFVGEVIRSEVSNKREKYYKEKGMDCYMIKIDDGLVVDGTMKGNIARFINHSCKPNCSIEVLELHGKQYIIIFARSSIKALDEITCNYKFPSENDKISCRCGSDLCRRVSN